MKQGKLLRNRLLSVLLAVLLIAGTVAGGGLNSADITTEADDGALSRQELETVVNVIDGETDVSLLSDEELSSKASELVAGLNNGKDKSAAISVDEHPEAYDENGAMTVPFDLVYPELIENGSVAFSDEALLVKMSLSRGGKPTKGMRAAGVAELEEIVPLEEAAWYKARLAVGTDAKTALAKLRELDEVLLAEYDYQIQTAAIDAQKPLPDDKHFDHNRFEKDQWYMHHCGIPNGIGHMKTDGGSSSVVVAVIDTGVDYDHEDLSDNIWRNTDEIPDNGIDDDRNGYVDDYYGADIVAGKGNGDDDNGHGTHVAGIIAAQNNKLGTVGIAYNVKIMPVKAAMASGYLNESTIAKSVIYAYENGAEVINMSFGGTACSIAVQDALAVAYTRCVLVASAGNDGMYNEGFLAKPNYPAALSYVLGVMSIDRNGVESGFTNWDVKAFNGIEYELYAPGEEMISTLPGDRYGFLSGTSMAAPVVSAIAAIVRSEYSDRDKYPTKFVYGQLASTSEYNATCCAPTIHGPHNLPQVVNLYTALTKMPKPEVGLQTYALFDTEGLSADAAGVNNGDGVIDAGETVALGLTLRNRWGMSKDTVVTIDTKSTAGIDDPYIEIINPSVNYGSVGTYSTQDCGKIYTDELLTGWENPFYIHVKEDCPNDYIFTLNVTVTCRNALDEEDTAVYTKTGKINLTVRKGVILSGTIEEDMTLISDKLYIIPNATVIAEGTVVRVEPGTHIQFWSDDAKDPYASDYIAYLKVNGKLLVEGTRENPVYIYPSELMDRYPVELGESSTGYISLEYADITNLYYCRDNTNTANEISYADHCTFRFNYDGRYLRHRYLSSGRVDDAGGYSQLIGSLKNVRNSVFYKISNTSVGTYLYGKADRCIFADCGIEFRNYHQDHLKAQNCVFLGNTFVDQTNPNYYKNSSLSVSGTASKLSESAIKIYYREETGTTYATAPTAAMSIVYDYADYHLKSLGFKLAVIETKEELDWINSNKLSGLLGIRYDKVKDRFVWNDGSDIQSFIDPDGVAVSALPNKELYYSNYKLTAGTGVGSALYELDGEILPTDITFKDYEVTLDTDAAYQIAPKTLPAQLTNDLFIYESRDESVVRVSDTGLVTPVGKGSAEVYVYSKDRAVYNYITFNVVDYVPLEGLTLTANYAEVAVGETITVECDLTPENSTRRNVKYTSSNENVAKVDSAGNITGVSSGTAVITAVCEGFSDTVTVKAYQKATELKLDSVAKTAALSEGTAELPEVLTNEGAETLLSWRSVDASVADIEDGRLVLNQNGTTTLEVTDVRSGLKASCFLSVQDSLNETIKKVKTWYRYHYVLTESGKLYTWNSGYYPQPTLITENIKDFDVYSEYLAVLRNDGTVERWLCNSGSAYVSSTYTFFTGREDIEKIAYYGDSYFVLTSSGNAYAWGGNSQGCLGVGVIGSVSEPMLVNLDGVTDIVANGNNTVFLTEKGDIYYSGFNYYNDTSTAEPILTAQNASSIIGIYSSSIFAYRTNDGELISKYFDGGFYNRLTLKRDYDTVCAGDYWFKDFLGIKDGKVFVGSSQTQVDGINNAVGAWVYKGTQYIYTADGMLFGLGANHLESNDMAGSTTEQNLTAPVLIPLERTEEELQVLSAVQTGDSFTVTFNKALNSASPKLYIGDMQVTLNYSIKNLNTLVITRASGFEEGVEYRLVLDANAVNAAGGITNAEPLELTFTYTASGNNGSSGEDGNTSEKVVHNSVTDETIERILTPKTLTDKINALQEKYQYNSSFYGNVVLNRISTDTNVEHWLRLLAPSSEGAKYPLGGNYWGTVNETAIGLQLIDGNDFITYARLMYSPYLTEAPEDVFPFVTGITILNEKGEAVTTVGNELITVRITFNRDMDTSIPLLVRFGSAYPFGDYEIAGGYVNARTWEGTYRLTTVIENGNQYFTVSGGRSADGDLELMTDRARFGFVIDTTAAQALIMQGAADDNGIRLTWTQDDFDTLMGYNVYRSTSEDGLYVRLNSTVIPFDTMEFYDDTVEPGVRYYYNFTVVKTDLTESIPSGKITIMSKDTMAPSVYHSPVYNATTGRNLIIEATVTDNLYIEAAKLYFRIVGEEEWRVIIMNSFNDKYSAIIPADYITTAGIEYYIEAFDGVSYTYKGTVENPYTVAVREEVTADSLGDVNGDGKISTIDALMLLKAVNDQLNLTAEQFARADLDGNGSLSAKEALRILQYVSGTVGSVDMRG